MNYGWLITFSKDFNPLDSLTNSLSVHTGVGGAWTFFVRSFLCAHLWMCPFIQAACWLITSASAPRLNRCCSHLEDSARIFIFSLVLHWNLLILLVCWRASISLIHFECSPGLCVFCSTHVFSVILNCAVPICLMCLSLYCFFPSTSFCCLQTGVELQVYYLILKLPGSSSEENKPRLQNGWLAWPKCCLNVKKLLYNNANLWKAL